MGFKQQDEEFDIEEAILKVDDTYGEEVSQKFSDLVDLNTDEAFKYLGKLFLGLIPEEDEDEFGEEDE